MEILKVKRVIVGSLETNCYLVWDLEKGEGVVIDPGADGSRILSEISEHKLVVKAVLLTHAHFDHILACGEMSENTGAAIFVGEEDVSLLKDPGWMRPFIESESRGSAVNVIPEDKIRVLKEGDTVQFGRSSLRVIETPGHTPGSLSYYGEGHLFCGDLLFRGSVGRTDLPGGNEEDLFRSITQKVLTLPDDTLIHPGHDGPTTIGREKQENPYLFPSRW